MKRTPLRRVGEKSRSWYNTRRYLVEWCSINGIVMCELGLDGCTKKFGLGFAHAVKRRFIRSDAAYGSPEHLETACLACTSCHELIERGPSETMKRLVMQAISRRRPIWPRKCIANP